MILYNVTVNIDPAVQEDWLRWMKQVHIPEVLDTGLFIEYRMFRVMNTAEDEGLTYAIQYFLPDLQSFEIYERDHAPRLRLEHSARYNDKFVAIRTILEAV